jgi:hypothetical protein
MGSMLARLVFLVKEETETISIYTFVNSFDPARADALSIVHSQFHTLPVWHFGFVGRPDHRPSFPSR